MHVLFASFYKIKNKVISSTNSDVNNKVVTRGGNVCVVMIDLYSFVMIDLYSFVMIYLYSFVMIDLYSFVMIYLYSFVMIYLYSFVMIYLYSDVMIYLYSFVMICLYVDLVRGVLRSSNFLLKLSREINLFT